MSSESCKILIKMQIPPFLHKTTILIRKHHLANSNENKSECMPSGLSDLDQKWVTLEPNVTNLGFLKIRFQYILGSDCPILTYFGTKSDSLACIMRSRLSELDIWTFILCKYGNHTRLSTSGN